MHVTLPKPAAIFKSVLMIAALRIRREFPLQWAVCKDTSRRSETATLSDDGMRIGGIPFGGERFVVGDLNGSIIHQLIPNPSPVDLLHTE